MAYDLTALIRRIKKLEARLDKSAVIDRPAPIVGSASTAVAQAINNNTITIVQYNTVIADTASAITTGAGWKYTIPIAGYYCINAAMLFAQSGAWAAGEVAEFRIYIDGGQSRTIDRDDEMAGPTLQYKRLGGSAVLYLTAGQTVDIRVLQVSGVNLTLLNNALYNYFDIHKLN